MKSSMGGGGGGGGGEVEADAKPQAFDTRPDFTPVFCSVSSQIRCDESFSKLSSENLFGVRFLKFGHSRKNARSTA